MANSVDFKFEAADGASQPLDLVKPLQSQYMLEFFDAAAVSWLTRAKKLQLQHLVPTLGRSTLDGVFWGMVFGLIFFVPFLSLVAGTAMEAISGKITDYGINENFVKSVRERITEATSAIFLLTGHSTTNKVVEALKQLPKFELI